MRDRILSAARELFAKQGFEATTVDEIARLADVAPATFFNHFQTKQNVLELMTGEVFEYLRSITARNFEREGDPLDKLRGFIASAAEAITSSRGIARDVLLEFVRMDGTPGRPHPYLERLTEPFVALVAEAQQRGQIRSDRDAAFLAQMMMGMMNSAITNWLADPAYPVETGLVDATEFALETLRPRMPEAGRD
ncbi:MAG TPA: TetR/AcrR family transcriptional regulator [Myxococcota bacterium]|nr:TetR/AcrR family transcriptional regulator [Myxococcales bacterium]HPG24324.1 TetR/AcrR family transcriptional regulator [Myxococcota bacterium]